MQKAETVLSILKQKSKQDESHRYDRIYRNLFNEDFFLRAYQKIHAKQGNMTPGTDGTTIDGFSRKQISQLIELLKWERYQPKPVRRTYIPKKNGKMRPLGIPAFADKLVQEVVRQILEAIYEPIFSDNSHGFRPNRSCHTALYQIKSTCRGTNWVIEGDITGCFDHIDHEILLKILLKKIDDGRFLELIWKFLKAGYLEFNQKYNSLSGTPQGGIISPILANIYLHEFDKFMEGISAEYTKGKQRRPYREYQILQYKRNRAKKKGNQEQADEYLRQMQNIPALDPMDKNYQRVKYVRYQPKKKMEESKLPVALTRFLDDHPHVKTVYLHLDNDTAGRLAAKAIMAVMPEGYRVENKPPPRGKDVNDFLCHRLGIPIRGSHSKEPER